MQNVGVALSDLRQVCKGAGDLLECRIGRLLASLSSCPLLVVPEDASVSPSELLVQTERSVQDAAATLSW